MPNCIRMAWKLPLLDAVASKRNVLFARQYYGTYDCFKCIHIFQFETSLGFAWKSCMARLPLVFEHFGLWQCRIRVPTGDCIFWWHSSTPSFPVAFSSFWNGAVTRDLFCARGFDGLLCITQYLQKPFICKGLYTGHVYFSNHEGWNTSFWVCLSFPLTATVLEKKPLYEGDGVKWFLRYFFFLGSEEFLDQL